MCTCTAQAPTAAFHPSSLSDHLFGHSGAECACPSCLIRWHPNESHKLYLDFHNKFGLSPLNADRVDLERYPEFAGTAPMHMKVNAGDAFYIPEGHWHLIISHGPRNVAVALEFAPFAYGEQQHWPAPVAERYHWPGLFWAESVLIRYAMRERYGAEHACAHHDAITSPQVCDARALRRRALPRGQARPAHHV